MWLALGDACTGLDINGQNLHLPAANDNLLTDLVIPGCRSTCICHLRTHIACRLERSVGIGRLVRREGLPHNRRIFVLDGRLHDPKFENFLAPIKVLIGVYPVRSWMRHA